LVERDSCIASVNRDFLPYPQNDIQNLFVRRCYVDVFDLLVKRIGYSEKSFAISGTPGIGKSLFFVYIMFQIVKGRLLNFKQILYQRGTSFECFYFKEKIVCDSKENAYILVRDPETLYIIDGRDSEPLLSSCVVLFISSPRSEQYKEFVKQKTAKQFFLPVWTFEELQNCRMCCYSSLPLDLICSRYQIYGGAARPVFHSDFTWMLEDMGAALADVDAVKGVRHIGSPTKIFQTTHTLLHIIVSDDGLYRFLHVDVASKYVGEQLWQLHHAQMIINMQEMFSGSPNEISRHLFEIYGHLIFSRGGKKLKCKNLEDESVSEITLEKLDGKRISFVKDKIPDVLEAYYYEPFDENFPAIDSFSPQGLFQFTVAPEHPIRGARILGKVSQLFQNPKLYFVVPPHRFERFKKQKFLASDGNSSVEPVPLLKQFVLELPVAVELANVY